MTVDSAPPLAVAVEEHHGGAHEDEHEDEHLPLLKALRERLVKLEGMEPAMKLLLGAVFAQLFVGALLLGLRGVSMPSIVGDATSDTEFSDIPDVVFVLAMVGFCLAWALVLAGVYRAGWLLRVVVGGAFGWAFWDSRSTFEGESAWAAAGCGACLILVLLLAIVTYWPERRFRRARASGDEAPVSKGLHRLRIATPFVLFVLIAGACGIAWLGAVHADKLAQIGHADVNSNAVGFTTTFSYLLSNHQYVLIPLLVLAGSEFGDWGDFVSRRLTKLLRRASRAWLVAAVTIVAAGLMIFDGIKVSRSDDGGGLLPEALLGAVVIGSVLLVALVAKPSGGWSPKVPFAAVAFVALTDTVSGFFVFDHLSASDPLLDLKIYGVSTLIWSVAAAVCLVVLAAARGRLSPAWVNGLVFVVLVGATETLQDLPALGTVVHPFGLNLDNSSFLGMEGVIGDFAVLAVLLVLFAAVTRRLAEWETPIAVVLVLLLGLEALYRIDHLFGHASNAAAVTGNFAIAAAVIMIVALSWEFLSSGEKITNEDSSRFSRSMRLYIFSGYVLLVAVSVLYYSDLHVHGTHNVIESEFDSEEWVREGILFLGVPVVMTFAIARIQRWRLSRLAGEPEGEEAVEGEETVEAETAESPAGGA